MAHLENDTIEKALEVLRTGGVVAAVTESFFGLLADARDESAIEKVFLAKKRPAAMTSALIIPNIEAVEAWAEWPNENAKSLAKEHWPGALTLLCPVRDGVSSYLHQDGLIGMRIPGPSHAATLVKRFGSALTATSANLSGEPAVRSSSDLSPVLIEGIDLVIHGEGESSQPSTLLDVTKTPARMLRQGAIEVDLR